MADDFVDPLGPPPAKAAPPQITDGGDKPEFVDPLGRIGGEDVPLPTPKPKMATPWTTAVGAFAKKAIPLPDWFLEGDFEMDFPGRGRPRTLTEPAQRVPASPGPYPSREKTREELGPVVGGLVEGGGAAVPASGVLGAASRLIKPVQQGAGALQRAFYEMLRPYRTAPAASTALDAALGGTGGAAGGFAEEMAPDSPWTQLGAQTLGSVAPIAAYGAARGGLERAFGGMFGMDNARRAARDTIRQETQRQGPVQDFVEGPDGQMIPKTWLDIEDLDAAALEAPRITGWQPETGQLLDDPFLLRSARQDPTRDVRVRENQRALRGEIESGVPEGDPSLPGLSADRALRRAQDRVNAAAGERRTEGDLTAQGLENQASQAAQTADTAAARAASLLPDAVDAEARKEVSSRRLAELAAEREKEARKHGGTLFDEVTDGVDPTTLKSPLYGMRSAIDRVKRLAYEEGREDALPAGLKGVKDKDGQTTGKYLEDYLSAHQVEGERGFTASAPYTRTKGMRERLQEEMRDPTTTPKTKRYLGMLLEGLNKDLDDSLPPAILMKDRAARENWRKNVVDRFQHPEDGPRNPIADVLEGKVAGQTLVRPGEQGGRAADSFVAAFGKEPVGLGTSEAHDQLRSWVMDHAGRSPQQIGKFVADHGPFLERFPTLRDNLQAAAVAKSEAEAASILATTSQREAATGARQARSEAEAVARDLERSGNALSKTTIAGRLAKDDPDAVARQLTTAREADRARRLFKRDPEAWKGLQAAYYRRITDEILPARDSGPVKVETINRFLRDHGPIMDRVLDSDQADRIRKVAGALKYATRDEGLRGVPNQSITQPLRQQTLDLAARFAMGGVLGAKASAALKLIGVTTQQEAANLVRRAAVEPEVFRELMRMPDKVRPARLGLTARAAGQVGAAMGQADDKEEGILWKKLMESE